MQSRDIYVGRVILNGLILVVQTGPEAHQASCTMGTGSFPLTPHTLLVPRSKNGVGLTSSLPKGLHDL
jgi:hypothetical protein